MPEIVVNNHLILLQISPPPAHFCNGSLGNATGTCLEIVYTRHMLLSSYFAIYSRISKILEFEQNGSSGSAEFALTRYFKLPFMYLQNKAVRSL